MIYLLLLILITNINAKCINLNYNVNLNNITNEYFDYFTTTSAGPVTFITNSTPCNSNLDQISLQSNYDVGELVYGIQFIPINITSEINKEIPNNITFRLNLYIDQPGKECKSNNFTGTLCYPSKDNIPVETNSASFLTNNLVLLTILIILS